MKNVYDEADPLIIYRVISPAMCCFQQTFLYISVLVDIDILYPKESKP